MGLDLQSTWSELLAVATAEVSRLGRVILPRIYQVLLIAFNVPAIASITVEMKDNKESWRFEFKSVNFFQNRSNRKKKGHDYDVIYQHGEQTIDLSSVIKDD